MDITISLKYEETKASLRERIRQGTISVLEAKATNHSCYFCLKQIDGKMLILTDREQVNGKESESNYFIDNICYMYAKGLRCK